MPEKATCELVLLVDANGDYAVGKDFDAAKDNYESDVQELSACEGGFRVVRMTVGVPLPEVVELAGDAPEVSGKGDESAVFALLQRLDRKYWDGRPMARTRPR